MTADPGETPVVTVVGLGTMGSTIAWLFARAGWQVRAVDADPDLTDAGVARIAARAAGDTGIADTDDALERVLATDDLPGALRSTSLAIEAVSEDVEVKREVLARMAEHAPVGATLATNTSSLPIDGLAAFVAEGARRRFLGMHFFNPADLVPGVEVIPHDDTDPAIVQRCLTDLRAVGKDPAVVRSSPGFIANRLQFALFLEAAACVEEGLVTPEDLDTVVRSTFGFRLPGYGPFQIADMAGLDVYVSILEVLAAGLGTRFSAPPSLVDRVARGEVGLKSGRGYGEYPRDDRQTLLERRDRLYRAIAAAIE